MDLVKTARMDRTKLVVATLDDEDSGRADLEYWLAQAPKERLRAVELLRQVVYGYDPAADRLQRVLTVSPLERS